MECCTRYPVNTSRRPSSICTGIWTIISRLGLRSTFHSPSSRFSFFAARSKRAACACQGLVSCSRSTSVVIKSPQVLPWPLPYQVMGKASQSILLARGLGKGGECQSEYCIYNVRTLMYGQCVYNGGTRCQRQEPEPGKPAMR